MQKKINIQTQVEGTLTDYQLCISSEVLGRPSLMQWLVGLTNTINFLDSIDGLAASLSLLCSFLLFITTALITKQTFLIYPPIAICGASFAFLIYNWYPAKLFMGDAGANFSGFMLGGLSVMGDLGRKKPIVAFTSPLLILRVYQYTI